MLRNLRLRLSSDNQSEFSSASHRQTTPAQRLAIAARLAAVSVLTNRYLISRKLERSSDREDVLDIATVLGYYEEQAGGEHVEVSKDMARETLETALFGECVDGVQAWRHQSYAEFLAARYLEEIAEWCFRHGLRPSKMQARIWNEFGRKFGL